MLVCSVVLRPQHHTVTAALAEVALAIDDANIGGSFTALTDNPAAADDTFDAFLGQTMAEAASASDAVNATAGSGGIVGTTFDPATVFETTLTGGNLIATRTTADFIYGGARSVGYKSTGKYYFEIILGTWPSGFGWSLGILKDTGTYQNLTGDCTNCAALVGGGIYSNNANFGSLSGGYTPGQVICWAVDLDARLAWVRKDSSNWNDSGTANPATGAGGMTIATGNFAPAVGYGSSSLTASTTANFGATAFAQAVPGGFISGWPV